MSLPFPVLLVSGLPSKRPSSYSRQLGLLGEALRRNGMAARPCAAASVAGLLRRRRAAALVLLGYPDQFPFLKARDFEFPAFLWAQCSYPPDPASFGPALPVPLTPRSAELLRGSGCPRIGPVIPHGVDTALYKPLSPAERVVVRRRRGLEGAFVVGTVAAHTLRKRFDLIVEAFARFREHRPRSLLLLKTDRVTSLDGSDLRLEARRHGVESWIRVLPGEYTPKAMVELYGIMDLYLNLSEWEGFCVPVVEAMACGLPVVTHPVQGPGEIVPYRELMAPGSRPVQEGATTLLVADPAAAAGVLLRAADSPQRLRRLGELGRREAVNSYDLRRVAGLWQNLLEARGKATEGRG